jgi:hypothetical protein
MSVRYEEYFMSGFQILNNRQVYEERQRKYYIMRHEGLRRSRKPFPNAADLHLKLIDEKVNQKKAFTMATILGIPRLSTFLAMKQQQPEDTEAAANFFDYEIKNRTNFLRQMISVVDAKWLRGKGVMKVYVDPYDDYRIVCENVDPLYILMPDDVNGFEDSYEWVHVRQMNVKQFCNDPRYCQDYRDDDGDINKKVLDKCRGGKDAARRIATQRGRNFELIQEDKELREGYTHSYSSDTVIIWEHYVRTMGGIMVYPYCPSALDIEIRKPYGVPYKVMGRVSAPLFEFNAELKDEGWYSSRGVAEMIADKEIYGCKVWNAKADAMTFFTTPQYTSEVGVQNPANYRLAPGEVLPPGIAPVPLQNPPIAFDQEIAFARGEAELSAQSPDLGIEKPNQRGHEKRTAKEVGVASSIAQIGQTLDNFVQNDDLSRLYRHVWGLMLQYKRKDMMYFIDGELNEMPQQALHEAYQITAGGGTANWDKAQRVQLAVQRFELLGGKPNIDQDALVTDLIASDDPRLVKKLVVPTNEKAATEALDENTIINDMCPGPNRPSFPIPVLPGQDHLTRAKTILQWMDAANKMGTPQTTAEKQRLFQRLQQHMMMLKKMNPKGYQQLEMIIRQMEAQGQQKPMIPPGTPPMAKRYIGGRMPRQMAAPPQPQPMGAMRMI